jgi:CDP-diacylglycerol---glycerol-3-phosphate 3-phosphatidyltransferase
VHYELKPLELNVILGVNSFLILIFLYFVTLVFPRQELSEETRNRPRSFISNAVFREFWYFLLKRPKRFLINNQVSPNTLSLVGFLLAVAAGVAYAVGYFGIAGLMVIFASTFDVLDGHVARGRNMTQKSGSFFDSVLDRVGEAAMFFGLLLYYRSDLFWFSVIFTTATAAQIVSYARARAEGLGYDGQGGFFQRAERMIVLSFGGVAAPMLELFFGVGLGWFQLSLLIVALGSIQTALVRPFGIYETIRKGEKR